MADLPSQLLAQATGFDWDDGNEAKILASHAVSRGEVEQAFFQEPLLLSFDLKHSAREARYLALGRTVDSRLLHIVLTLRGTRIRPISARNMNRKERLRYVEASA